MPVSFGSFSRRFPDVITEELVALLSGKAAFGFLPLFDILFIKLRARKATSGGQDLLRLRVYEKLQALVHDGRVEKKVTKLGKKYRGLASLAGALPTAKEITGHLAIDIHVVKA